jgi:hypothetical protein
MAAPEDKKGVSFSPDDSDGVQPLSRRPYALSTPSFNLKRSSLKRSSVNLLTLEEIDRVHTHTHTHICMGCTVSICAYNASMFIYAYVCD